MSDEDFYATFTDRHRGPRDMVKSRLATAYLPFIEPLRQLHADSRTLDIGCGRGEWLELLQEHGFESHGIDLDDDMLADCRERGLSVEKQDAVNAFGGLADETQAIVSGFHIVEHIPFDVLQKMVRESMRVLKPGGLMILETPNPENILVSTSGFYLDPTHQRPIPLHLLAFLSEYCGFARVKVLRLNESPETLAKPVISLLDVLGGVSPDYAVVAQKSGSEEQMALTGQPFMRETGVTLEALVRQYDQQAETRIARVEARIAQAETRIAQAEARAGKAEEERQAMLASRSWRITKPLRDFGTAVRRVRGKTGVMARQGGLRIGARARRLLSGAFHRIMGNATVRRNVLQVLGRFPRVEARLRRMLAFVRNTVLNEDSSSLSPRARHAHARLMAAIERRKREHD